MSAPIIVEPKLAVATCRMASAGYSASTISSSSRDCVSFASPQQQPQAQTSAAAAAAAAKAQLHQDSAVIKALAATKLTTTPTSKQVLPHTPKFALGDDCEDTASDSFSNLQVQQRTKNSTAGLPITMLQLGATSNTSGFYHNMEGAVAACPSALPYCMSSPPSALNMAPTVGAVTMINGAPFVPQLSFYHPQAAQQSVQYETIVAAQAAPDSAAFDACISNPANYYSGVYQQQQTVGAVQPQGLNQPQSQYLQSPPMGQPPLQFYTLAAPGAPGPVASEFYYLLPSSQQQPQHAQSSASQATLQSMPAQSLLEQQGPPPLAGTACVPQPVFLQTQPILQPPAAAAAIPQSSGQSTCACCRSSGVGVSEVSSSSQPDLLSVGLTHGALGADAAGSVQQFSWLPVQPAQLATCPVSCQTNGHNAVLTPQSAHVPQGFGTGMKSHHSGPLTLDLTGDVSSPYAMRAQQPHAANRSSALDADAAAKNRSRSRNGYYNNILYKTEVCTDFLQKNGQCPRGRSCQYAHGPDEIHDPKTHPLYKTALCYDYKTTGACPRKEKCFHVHCLSEMRTRSSGGGSGAMHGGPAPAPSAATANAVNAASVSSTNAAASRFKATRNGITSSPINNRSTTKVNVNGNYAQSNTAHQQRDQQSSCASSVISGHSGGGHNRAGVEMSNGFHTAEVNEAATKQIKMLDVVTASDKLGPSISMSKNEYDRLMKRKQLEVMFGGGHKS